MHQPVLLKEVVDLLNVHVGGRYVDGTLGSGGHTAAILARIGADGSILGMDQDEDAIERTRVRLSAGSRAGVGAWTLVHGNFEHVEDVARQHGISEADGLILDLGVSSEQLDLPDRGFSFQKCGPLDMRMDRSQGRMAADLVNELDEADLEDLIRTFGEERQAGRIARAMVMERGKRRILTTEHLAELVERATGGRRGRIHPATRTFQALRIRVNGELDVLSKGIEGGLRLLAVGGRMAVISFHSLEDRIVKRSFQRHAGRWVSLQEGGRIWEGTQPQVRWVTRKPVEASLEEQAANPRSRSAKLRVVERMT